MRSVFCKFVHTQKDQLEKRVYTRETRLAVFNNFNSVFEDQLAVHDTYRSAFEAAEEIVGRFYASYESFKAARTQNRKNKRMRV